MTLMTRCTYRFYHRPEELRRLNNSTLIIGDPASGKSFATRLFKLLTAPIVAADKVGKDAINAYRELIKTKGANKEKPKKPKVVVRVHPARTSNAQFIRNYSVIPFFYGRFAQNLSKIFFKIIQNRVFFTILRDFHSDFVRF